MLEVGDHLELLAGRDGFGIHLRGRADEDRVCLRQGSEQGRAIGTIAMTDLEVGTEGLDGRGRELLGDENDGLGHGTPQLIAVSGSASLATRVITPALAAARP